MTNEEQDYRMDGLLRQRLEGAEAPVPADLWDRIQHARQERRARPYGWAGFGALVLITAVYAGWMSMQPAGPATPVPEVTETETADAGSDPGHGALTWSQPDPGPEGSAEAPGQVHDYAPARNRTFRADSPADASGSSARKTPLRGRTGQNASASKPGSAAESGIGATGESGAKGDQALLSLPADHQEVISAGNAPGALDRLLNPYAFHALRNESGPETAGLPAGPVSILHSGKKTPSCYAFNSFLRGLSTDLYIAPEYASRQLVYKDPAMIEYAERRKSTESYSFAFSAGFRVNAHFEGGLALRTGLIYTDIVEKLTYADPDAEVRRVITISIDTIYNPPDVIIMVDTLSIAEYGQYDKVGYNNYRFYDVPLILGYEIDRGPWILSLNTGLMLNVGTSRRGNMLDPSANLVSIHSSRPDGYPAFRTKVGTSLLMSLGVNYAIRPKLHLLLEPQLRVWMRPLTLKEYPVDQKYVNMGLAMGLRQYF